MEAAYAATMKLADGGADYGRALSMIMIFVFGAVFVLALIGRERRGIAFVEGETAAA